VGLALVVAVVAGVFALLKLGGQPPDIDTDTRRRPSVESQPDSEDGDAGAAAPGDAAGDGADVTPAGRRKGVYTFLILGMDDGNGNTDTVMTATLDTVNYTLDVVNMPRDTLVNVSWNTKKINTLYANLGIEGTVERLADVLGYKADKYAVVDMKAFKALVDAIGGVDFDVPVNMNYDDPAQNLSIHYTKGMHHLSGDEALEVVRFRGFASADIGRIGTQQDFLMTMAKQLLAAKNSIKVTDLASIFIKYVKTDLTLQNIIWLASELYKLDAENITFTTLPGNYIDDVGGNSYVTIYVDEWLELINSGLNPFLAPIMAEELSILTRNSSGAIYSTDGHYEGRQSWGQSSGSSSKSSGSGQSSATPTPTPTRAPERQPEGEEPPPELSGQETGPAENGPDDIDTTPATGDGDGQPGGAEPSDTPPSDTPAAPSDTETPPNTAAPPSDSPTPTPSAPTEQSPPPETSDTDGTDGDGDSPPDWLG
jgi:LCP family protein required for cell wall assembly